jgi:hypothetical protein
MIGCKERGLFAEQSLSGVPEVGVHALVSIFDLDVQGRASRRRGVDNAAAAGLNGARARQGAE